MPTPRLVVSAALLLASFGSLARADYPDLILEDGPVAYYRLGEAAGSQVANHAAGESPEALAGKPLAATLGEPGPRAPEYPLFGEANLAARFNGGKSYIVVPDPGEGSTLDFNRGDSITIEAWVNPAAGIPNDHQVYVIGKGRTNNPGVAPDNQNWSLRLRGQGNTARISFLFRGAENRRGNRDDWHRWTSDAGFLPGSGWHHVAVSYTFGEADSLRGYLDGQPVGGTWDYGGATDAAPVVDDDEVWIGSSLGGSPAATFPGLIDEVALYRKVLPPERISARFERVLPDPILPPTELPEDALIVELFEGVPDHSWDFVLRQPPSTTYQAPAFGFVDVPRKYNRKALIIDRSNPFLLRATGRVALPEGEHRLLLRAHNAARLYLDDQLIAQTPFRRTGGSAHDEVPDVEGLDDLSLKPLPVAHAEHVATLSFDGKPHVFRLEMIVGGKSVRAEVGELMVAVARSEEPFRLLAPEADVFASEEGWQEYTRESGRRLARLEAETRRQVGAAEAEYWNRRHELARETVAAPPQPPQVSDETPVFNDIDRFIGARLEEAGVQPAPLTDDYTFLRRVTLDTVGRIPTPQEIAAFAADSSEQRRQHAIDRLLDDPGWADHWVGYWQDVLAENPGILKPKLNNTGPFRWWIHESLRDNKPYDRFVTELVMMEGSTYGGGPAGFALATQNDVPMAAKAHILGTALLGVEMKCARCHDAPFHPFKQGDLFSVAAMLKRGPQSVPKSSTVPLGDDPARRPHVEITLKPGQSVAPEWPFAELIAPEADRFPEGVLRSPGDSRERLAALVTSPRNERFAQVIANRLWKRYLGWGLVEPVDDWEGASPSHPALLDYLARDFVAHGYDLKHLARQILNSHAYQRVVESADDKLPDQDERLFASPARRRMTAEQLVDSLLAAVDKPLGSEELNMDRDGRRPANTFLNLGNPRRAWEFTSLSNERDRPALAMPRAQAIVDVLTTFGWRETRQDPITVREQTPTVLQPLILANGILGHRVATLSDDSAVTDLCLEQQPLERLVERIFLQVLSRPPTSEERQMFVELLADGYGERFVQHVEGPAHRREQQDRAVSWSNHLSAEANRIKLQVEQAIRAGDPPTPRLAADWRQRAEDMLWSLVNSPEFLFIP